MLAADLTSTGTTSTAALPHRAGGLLPGARAVQPRRQRGRLLRPPPIRASNLSGVPVPHVCSLVLAFCDLPPGHYHPGSEEIYLQLGFIIYTFFGISYF